LRPPQSSAALFSPLEKSRKNGGFAALGQNGKKPSGVIPAFVLFIALAANVTPSLADCKRKMHHFDIESGGVILARSRQQNRAAGPIDIAHAGNAG
jgi:hypothetical protein